MTYRQIKWLILLIPTLTIGLWEYLRHTVLLPFISMELGNWLAPVIVLIVTMTLLRRLFRLMEETQEALQRERLQTAAMQEREHLAYELHDGISQSLFLLSVKLDRLESSSGGDETRAVNRQIRETVRRIHDDVRQSIAGLRSAPDGVVPESAWTGSVRALAEDIERSGGPVVGLDWRLPENALGGRDKVELLAIVREALINAHKHAEARQVRVKAEAMGRGGFRCFVEDDGRGASPEELGADGRFGIRMMRSRAEAMRWRFDARTGESGGLLVEIAKEGEPE